MVWYINRFGEKFGPKYKAFYNTWIFSIIDLKYLLYSIIKFVSPYHKWRIVL